jgi:hypothetical protein
MRRVLRPIGAALLALGALALLAACSAIGGGRVRLEPEAFGSTTTHSRRFDTAPAYTCEAARRALLSQGFVITAADGERVNGRKYFQPEPEVHVQLEFHTVCAPDGRGGRATLAFVNALQDRYALKKSNNSASVGVGAIGSLSLPFTSSDDSLVKVASETITSAPFYDRFFTLLQRYLAADAELAEPRNEPVVIAPIAASAPVVRAAVAASAPAAAASAASAP